MGNDMAGHFPFLDFRDIEGLNFYILVYRILGFYKLSVSYTHLEELTEKEIGQFVNELSEVSLDSFTEAFEMASRKIQELSLIHILFLE